MNNYAITSEELATSLTKSIAALKVAGNSLEQIEALEVAGNTIVQDADVVSNSLKVLSMRLRGTTGSALEEIGEDTEGLIENFSKLNNKIQALTKTASNPEGVSIVDKQTKAYKSTYEILLEISKVWNDITDMRKAELLEIIAGKTRATATAAILESPETLQQAYQDAMFGSEGAGAKAVETSVESIESRIKILQNNLKKLGQDIIGSDVVKDVTNTIINTIQEINKGANNLKPIVQILTEFLNLVLKVIGMMPSGGIIGGVLGWKNRNNAMGMNILQGLDSRGLIKLPIQESDVALFEKYAATVEEGTWDQEVWNSTMGQASKEARDFAQVQILAGKSNEEVTASLKQQIKATNGLKIAQTALNMVMTMAISIVITKFISLISDCVHAEEEFKKSTQEVASTFKNTENDLSSAITKIQELTDKLNDNNTTAEEAIKCRTELSKIQDELFEKYGTEAESINLITQAINGEVDALKILQQLKWEETLNNFNNEHNDSLFKNFERAEGFWDNLAATWAMFVPGANDDAASIISEVFGSGELMKSAGEVAYEKWLNGDNEYADFAKLYMQYEVLQDEYKEQYDKLVNLEAKYKEELINGTLTDEIKKTYADSYQEILDSIEDNKVADKVEETFFKKLKGNKEEYNKWVVDQENLAKEIADRRQEIFEKKILGRDENGNISEDRQFKYNGWINEYQPKFNIKEIEDAFNELGIDTEQELKILEQAIDSATRLGMEDVNDLFDLYKKRLAEVETLPLPEVFSIGDWYTKDSKLKKDDGKAYNNKEALDAYTTSLGQFTEKFQQLAQGEVELKLSDIVDITDADEFFQKLNMPDFKKYFENFGGDYEVAMLRYIGEAQRKIQEKLSDDLNPEDADILAEKLQKIQYEALGLSDAFNVQKIEDSYNELNKLLERVQAGNKFQEKEIDDLLEKYPSLKSALKEVNGEYTIQEDSLKNLVGEYAEVSNAAINAMRVAKRETLQTTIASLECALSLDRILEIYDAMINNREYDPTAFGKNTGAIYNLVSTYKKEMAELDGQLKELDPYHYKTGNDKDKDGSGNKGNGDSKSNLDWLDVYLERINRRVDRAQKKLEDLNKVTIESSDIEATYYDKREAQIEKVNKQLLKQQKAYKKAEVEYDERMTSGVLYDNLVKAAGSQKKADKYIAKIKAGKDIKIEEMDSELQSAIQAAIDNWNKKKDAEDKQVEIGFEIKENNLQLVKDSVEEVISLYDKVLNQFEQRESELNHYQNMRTTQGYMANEQLYLALISNESKELAANIQRRDELTKKLNEFVPETKEELDYWYEIKDQIDDTTAAIYENQEAIAQWQNEIKKLEWDLNDKITELKYGVIDETNFLINHLASGDADMYSYEQQYLGNDAKKTKLYNGKMSSAGMATLAMRLTAYQAYLEKIEDIGKQIAEAEELYLQDTSNVENLERLNALKQAQQQAIEGYDAEKEAIIALVKEGYDKQLESLQNLIDKYMEAEESAKD